jgi:hypothetical protein
VGKLLGRWTAGWKPVGSWSAGRLDGKEEAMEREDPLHHSSAEWCNMLVC